MAAALEEIVYLREAPSLARERAGRRLRADQNMSPLRATISSCREQVGTRSSAAMDMIAGFPRQDQKYGYIARR